MDDVDPVRNLTKRGPIRLRDIATSKWAVAAARDGTWIFENGRFYFPATRKPVTSAVHNVAGCFCCRT